MNIEIDNNKPWYHGTNLVLDTLRTGSTITQWKELAEAFSHPQTVMDPNVEFLSKRPLRLKLLGKV